MSITEKKFSRRVILQGAGAVALVGLGSASSGWPAFAANDKYPEEAFKQKSDTDAIKALYGKTAEASDKIKLDAPEIAENGAVVPVSVTRRWRMSPRSRSWWRRTRSCWWLPTSFRQAPCPRSPTASRWPRPAR